jgi:hypothetical protein
VTHVILGVLISSMLLTTVLDKQDLYALTSIDRYNSGFSVAGYLENSSKVQSCEIFLSFLKSVLSSIRTQMTINHSEKSS